jgi:hypothetical protein
MPRHYCDEYGQCGAEVESRAEKIPDFAIGDVDDVAEQGYQACLKGEVICVPGVVNLAATVAGRTVSKWLLRRVSGIVSHYGNKK